MTEIEKKALALVREVADGYEDVSVYHVHDSKTLRSALCRAIEQHEAFRQEVSDAVKAYLGHNMPWPDHSLRRFIIAKPDPLVEVIEDMNANPQPYVDGEHYSKRLRAAIEKRGGKIVWGDEA